MVHEKRSMNFAQRRMDRWYSSSRAAEPWAPTRLVYTRRCTRRESNRIGLSAPRLALSTPSIIAGNKPQIASSKLDEFWKTDGARQHLAVHAVLDGNFRHVVVLVDACQRDPRIFRAQSAGILGGALSRWGQIAPDSIRPRHSAKHLAELVDFSIVNRRSPRLTVGAANVRTSMMHYFDSRASGITTEHIMASGALPPAFPAVHIDGEYFWDGGILSNTPTEVIFDDNPRRNSLIFAVHLWNPTGPEPQSIWEVLHRQKDIQYSSRIASHITRQQQTHRLRHVVSQLVRHLPDDVRKSEAVRELAGYGCVTQMHVVRLLAPRLENENHTKDIDFSSIRNPHAPGGRLRGHNAST